MNFVQLSLNQKKVSAFSLFLFVTLLVFSSINLLQASGEKSFFNPPANCFDENTYCFKTTVIYGTDNTRYIHTNLYAMINEDEIESTDALLAKYIDFNKWPKYVERKDALRFVRSVALPPIYETDADGNKSPRYRHFSHYFTKAPFPINSLEVKEYSMYRYILPKTMPEWSDADNILHFELLKGRQEIPELGEVLEAPVGLKNKFGNIAIKHDKENHRYLLMAETNITPAIDLLPGIAAPYIEKSIVSVFEGIFDL